MIGIAIGVAMAMLYASSLNSGDATLPGAHAPHRYSDYDPVWTQVAFPRLGSPLAPPASPGGALTALAGGAEDSRSRRAALAAVMQALTLSLFCAIAIDLGAGAMPAAVATIALGFEPVMFGIATQWTPYLCLPALLLGALLARLRWLESSARTWFFVLCAASLAAVAESVYAIPLVAVVLWTPSGTTPSRPAALVARLWPIVAIVVAGLALQVLGVATALRSEAIDGGLAMSSRDAIVAATSRWGRLVELYAAAPLSGIPHRVRETGGELGLLAPMLASVGLLALFRVNRRTAWLLLTLAVLALAIDVVPQAPVSALSPALPILVAITFLAGAAGLAEVALAFRWPIVAVMCLGAILAGDGLAARRLSALDKSGRNAFDGLAPVDRLPPSSIVASDAELDRRLVVRLESPQLGGRVGRVPQAFAAMRQAHRPGTPLLVWPADTLRVGALGWLLAPAAIGAGPGDVLYEALEPTPCFALDTSHATDLARALDYGSISVHAERASSYEVEIEGDGLPPGIAAFDVVANRRLDLVARDSTHLSLAIDRARQSLPRIDFPSLPDRARARLITRDVTQQVRVCGAPARGEAVRLAHAGDSADLPVASRTIFERGWHDSEPVAADRSQRWSDGASGLVVVQIPGESAALEAVVEALPAAPMTRAPTLTLEVNGHALPAQPMFPGARPYTWAVPRAVIHRGLNTFRLLVPETFSPRSLGISEDDRRLGFAMSGFRLRRTE